MREISLQRKSIESERKLFNVTNKTFCEIYFIVLSICIQIFRVLLKLTFLYRVTYNQSQALGLRRYDFSLDSLPELFDGYRILFMSDFHINTAWEIEDKINSILDNIEFDICLLGGDYSFKSYDKDIHSVNSFMGRLTEKLKIKCKNIYTVLGNHDLYEMAEYLHSAGVNVLMNESVKLQRDNSVLFLSGVDDCVHYKSDDLALCNSQISSKDFFKILLSHSPDIYEDAEKNGYSLMLTGHTHGGQFCYPGGRPIVSNSRIPSAFIKGQWKYKNLMGLTSKGVGCSAFAGRLFCPPEISLITLHMQT